MFVKNRKIFFLLLASLVTAGLLYLFYKDTDKIVTIHATEKPWKKRPENPGGISIPNADNIIYESIRGHSSSKIRVFLQPPTEKPMDLKVFKSKATNSNGLQLEEEIQNMIDEFVENRNSITQTQLTDCKIIYIPELGEREIKKIANGSEFQNGYKLELGSFLSEYEAREEWKKLLALHPDLLVTTKLLIRKIHGQDNRVVFQLLAGEYSSINMARSICRKFSSRKQYCTVVR